MRANKFSIDLYLRHHSNYEPKAERLLTDSSEVQELLSSYFKPLSKELDDWMAAPYERNLKHPEHPLSFEMVEMLVKYYFM